MAKHGERKRLELSKIEAGHPMTERLSDALESPADDGAWGEQYMTPTKKKKPEANKRYPEPSSR